VDEQVVALFVRRRPDKQLVMTQEVEHSQDGLGVRHHHERTSLCVALQLDLRTADVVLTVSSPLQNCENNSSPPPCTIIIIIIIIIIVIVVVAILIYRRSHNFRCGGSTVSWTLRCQQCRRNPK